METKKLIDCCEFISDGDHLPPPKSDSGVPFITISNITGQNKLSFEDTMFVPESYYNGLNENKKAKKGDILYSVVGSFGKPVYVDFDKQMVFQRHIAILRPKRNVNARFIYYTMLNPQFYKLVDKLAIGCSQRTVTLDTLRNIEVNLPDKDIQDKMVGILSLIDEKIDINNNVNDNLEQQAKLLYDYWFTQFDFPDENGEPYRSSGGKMVWNEQLKRTIPDGWTTNPLSDIFTFKSGYSFSSDLYEVSGKYKLLTIKNVQNNGINLNVDNYINVLPDNVPDYCLLKAQDILMSLTGNVGRVGIMYADNCLLNQRVALAEPVNINQRVFVYFLLKSDIIHKQYEMIANGSSQQNLSPIEAEKVIIAYNPEVATKFSTLCNEYLNTIVSNLAENQELINIRDWLLPILMNGQATISD